MENEELGANLTGLAHLGLNCKKLERSLHFYIDILGLREQFRLTYAQLADDIKMKQEAKGKKEPFYCSFLRKRKRQAWIVYLKVGDNTFIELFDQTGAFLKKKHRFYHLNFTHCCLTVKDIKAFREEIIARGGEKYLEGDISLSLSKSYTMWMHDPDGNRFEIMEYREDSLQLK